MARLSRSERIAQACAEMREKQRLLREAERAGAVAVRESRRVAKETGAVAAKDTGPRLVGFTWGKPIPRRTKAQVRRARAAHRREKQPPQEQKPRCKCGFCPECARRARHTEYVRKRRQRAKEGISE